MTTVSEKFISIAESVKSASVTLSILEQMSDRENRKNAVFGLSDKNDIADKEAALFDTSIAPIERLAAIDVDYDDLSDDVAADALRFIALLDSALNSFIEGGKNPIQYITAHKKNDTSGNEHHNHQFTLSDGVDTLVLPIIVVEFRDVDSTHVEESLLQDSYPWKHNGEEQTDFIKNVFPLFLDAFVSLSCHLQYNCVYFPQTITEEQKQKAVAITALVSSHADVIEHIYKQL